MASGERHCPLCDAPVASELCPTHGVPTIVPSEGKRPEIPLEPGLVIGGRHRIERPLGAGGMGVLFHATQLGMDRTIVLKVLKSERLQKWTNIRRFYQEARAASHLNHPNIVRIYEFGVDPTTRLPYLVMEFVEGRTLTDIVVEEGGIPEKRTAKIFAQISKALLEAHDKGVLHRDLKPRNIMVGPVRGGDELVKVLDFGLAKILDVEGDTPPLTVPGKTVGTPWFMSPEQVTRGQQDFRTDLYGLGCVLHAVLTGRPPYHSEDLLELMQKHVRSPIPQLPDRLLDGAPPSPGLRQLHARLLAKSRYDRPASTEEVVQAFLRLTLESPPAPPAIKDEVTELERIPDGIREPAPTIEDAPSSTEAQTALVEAVGSGTLKLVVPVMEDSSVPAATTIEPRENIVNETVRLSGSDDQIHLDSEDDIATPHVPLEALSDSLSGPAEDWTAVLPSALDLEPGDTKTNPEPVRSAKTLDEDEEEEPNTVEQVQAIMDAPLRAPTLPKLPDTLPPTTPKRARFRILTLTLAGLAVVIAGIAIVLTLRRPDQPAKKTRERPTATARPTDGPSAVSKNKAAADQVTIRSEPKKAYVFEGKNKIGTTPVSVSAPKPKVLIVRKSGYREQTVQVSSDVHGRTIVVHLQHD